MYGFKFLDVVGDCFERSYLLCLVSGGLSSTIEVENDSFDLVTDCGNVVWHRDRGRALDATDEWRIDGGSSSHCDLDGVCVTCTSLLRHQFDCRFD